MHSIHPFHRPGGLRLFVLGSLLSLASSFSVQAAEAAPTVRDGPSEAVQAWKTAVEAGDIDTITRMHPEGLTSFTFTDNVLHDHRPVVSGYRAMLEKYRVHATVSDAHYVREGKLLVSWGLFALDLQPRDGGATVHLAGRFTDAATYRSGEWRYVLDHTSALPQAPAPAVAPAR